MVGGSAGDKRDLLKISRGSPTVFQLFPPTNKEKRVGNVLLVSYSLPESGLTQIHEASTVIQAEDI